MEVFRHNIVSLRLLCLKMVSLKRSKSLGVGTGEFVPDLELESPGPTT